MAFKYLSDEFAKELARQINASKAYEKAAKGWEGDILFVVEADKVLPETRYLFLGLHHGKCTECVEVSSEKEREAAYIFRAKFSTFKKLNEGKMNAVAAMMKRKLKLEGNLINISRYPKAGLELMNILSRIPTEY